MSEHYPVLVVIIPFLSAFAVGISGLWTKRSGFPIALLALGFSWFAAVGLLFQVLERGHVSYHLGGWPPPIGIAYEVDTLNALVLVLIATVALLTNIFSKQSLLQELPDKTAHFYTLYLLLVTGLLGITITGDAFNVYVLLEIASLTTYALVALGKGRAVVSCFNYIVMGTVGATFYLLGVGYLYIKTGSLNMADIHRILAANHLYGSQTVLVAFIFIMVGIWIKMAFFPLHGWLPNAYAFSPSAVSCLIAPLMTKVAVYLMIRMMFFVFSLEYVFKTLPWSNAVIFFATIAMIAGALTALAQVSLKKMLAYIIVAEVGYMVGGVWLANADGLTGAIFHIICDSLMTLCLFLAAGAIHYKTHGYRFDSMKGLYRTMPVTMACFTVGALSMIGIPPTCGFFSKWFLISGGIQAGQWGYVGALVLSSLVNAILFFRIIEMAFFKNPDPPPAKVQISEAPLSMLLPLSTVAVALVAVGIFSGVFIAMISLFVNGVGL